MDPSSQVLPEDTAILLTDEEGVRTQPWIELESVYTA